MRMYKERSPCLSFSSPPGTRGVLADNCFIRLRRDRFGERGGMDAEDFFVELAR